MYFSLRQHTRSMYMYIDLTKEFDTVSHSKLLGKLNEHEVNGGIEKQWMENDHLNRTQSSQHQWQGRI